MYISLRNFVASALGRPKYVPLYKRVGDEYIHVGYIKEDLSKGIWKHSEYMNPPFYLEISNRDMEYILSTLNVYGDGYSFEGDL